MHIMISAVSSARQPSGICRHAANLAMSLAATTEIRRVTFCAGPWQGYFQDAFDLRDSKINLVTVAVPNNSYARNQWYWRALPQLASSYRPDLIHLSFPAPFSRRRFACPIVASLHDLYPYDLPDNFGAGRAVFHRWFLQRCLRESDHVVCSSDATLGRLQALVPEVGYTKATRIYQCVTLEPNQCRAPDLPQLREQPFLLAVAQHRRNKNLGLLLSAFAELRQRRPSHRRLRLVVIGGAGPETNALTAKVQRLCLQGSVVFHAALPDAELCWLYRHCELLVAPSSIEGFGLPVAEALHSGSRVLCSDIPALREVGGSGCRYFPLTSESPISALANAIAAALGDSRSGSCDLSRFSPSEIAHQHLALYARVLGTKAHSHTAPLAVPQAEAVRQDRYAS